MLHLKTYGPNQTEVVLNDEVRVFFSYETPVAAYDDTHGKYYRTSKKWSRTTSRHINNWLDGVKAEERDQDFFDNLVK